MPDRSRALRGAGILAKQVAKYRGDRRAVIVFTITAANISDLEPIAATCADAGIPLTLHHYSPTTKYIDFIAGRTGADKYHQSAAPSDDLRLSADDLARSRDTVAELMERYGRGVVYSADLNRRMHDPASLYPSLDPATGVATDCGVRLTGSLRHYNTDLTSSAAKCCSPNVDCDGCRPYTQSFTIFLPRSIKRIREPGDCSRTIGL